MLIITLFTGLSPILCVCRVSFIFVWLVVFINILNIVCLYTISFRHFHQGGEMLGMYCNKIFILYWFHGRHLHTHYRKYESSSNIMCLWLCNHAVLSLSIYLKIQRCFILKLIIVLLISPRMVSLLIINPHLLCVININWYW